LTFLNRVDSGGGSPAFVAVDHSGRYVLVANYDTGTTRIFPIGADGSLGAPSDNQSPGKNSHMLLPDPANKFAFVMNLGSDTVTQYVFDASKGTLSPNGVPSVMTAKGAGPRHLAFHPNGKYAYLIAELADTMSVYSYDAALGQLTFLQTLSTLPVGVNGASNSCAEVVVAPSGKFVYGSNRGHDSIVTFSIDPMTGKLTFVGTTPSGGNVPRSFGSPPNGCFRCLPRSSRQKTPTFLHQSILRSSSRRRWQIGISTTNTPPADPASRNLTRSIECCSALRWTPSVPGRT
jgi:6-phosphogluconolactonase